MENNRIKIAILVSGGGTNLQAIIDAWKNGLITHGEPVLVVSSNPSAFAVKRAETAGIPAVTVSRKDCSDQREFEERIEEQLEKAGVGLIVLAGFMSILSSEFTAKYDHKIINVHPSLIPSFCGKGYYGLKVHKAALEKGVKVTGATVHYVNEIPDGGEIIAQKAVYVSDNDTPETLQRRVMESAEWEILPKAVEQVCRNMAENMEK